MIHVPIFELDWSQAAEMVVMDGATRLRRFSPPNAGFWSAWRSAKDELRRQGYRVEKSGDGFVVSRLFPVGTLPLPDLDTSPSLSADAEIDVPLPAELELLPYQRAGVAFMAGRPASLLSDEPGLGKTVQVIALANYVRARRMLVVCPASLKLNWRDELDRWLCPRLPVHVIDGKSIWKPSDDAGVWIVNYDLVGRGKFDRALAQQWDVVAFDEAHALRNPDAKRTIALLGNAERRPVRGRYSIAMTGTPIMNRPADLFPMLRWLDPGRWTDFDAFAHRYCGAGMTAFGLDTSGATNTAYLQALLRGTVMVRRLKRDVLKDLPPKMRTVAVLEHDASAASLIEADRRNTPSDEVLTTALDGMDGGAEIEGMAAYAESRHAAALAKMPAVVDYVLALEGKAIVFAHHRDVIEAVRAGLGTDIPRIVGGQAPESVEADKHRFQSDLGCRFIVCSIRAAGVGHTLTAADHVVFAELDWVPAVLSHAEDRAHRIGRVGAVQIHHVVLDGSLDHAIARALVRKQAAADRLLNTAVHGADEWPIEDWFRFYASVCQDGSLGEAASVAGCALVRRSKWDIIDACEAVADELKCTVAEARDVLRDLYRAGQILADRDRIWWPPVPCVDTSSIPPPPTDGARVIQL